MELYCYFPCRANLQSMFRTLATLATLATWRPGDLAVARVASGCQGVSMGAGDLHQFAGDLLATYWRPTGDQPTTNWRPTGNLLATYWRLFTGNLANRGSGPGPGACIDARCMRLLSTSSVWESFFG